MTRRRKLRRGGLIKYWWLDNGIIRGTIHQDKFWKDYEGEQFHTSLVVKITVRTNNTIYTLDPDSAYKKSKPVRGRNG